MKLYSQFKQSGSLIIVQIISIVIGVLSLSYYIVHLPTDVFALIASFYAMCQLSAFLSFFGVEQYLMRNALQWQQRWGKENRVVKFYYSISVAGRIYLSGLFVVVLYLYSYYLYTHTFDKKYFMILMLFPLATIPYSVNNGISLMLGGLNKYTYRAIISLIQGVVFKLLNIFLYIHFGFKVLMLSLMFMPLLLCGLIMFLLKRLIEVKYFKMFTFKYYKKFSIFVVPGVLKYLTVYFIQAVLPFVANAPEMASFYLVSRLEEIAQGVTAAIYTPYLQNLVKYKFEVRKFQSYIRELQKIKSILSLFAIIIISGVFSQIHHITSIPYLSKFKYIDYYLISGVISSFLYFMANDKTIYIALFAPVGVFFSYQVAVGVISFLLFLVIIALVRRPEYLYFYKVCVNFVLLIIASYVMSQKNNFGNLNLLTKLGRT